MRMTTNTRIFVEVDVKEVLEDPDRTIYAVCDFCVAHCAGDFYGAGETATPANPGPSSRNC